jgi:hypothetical protein
VGGPGLDFETWVSPSMKLTSLCCLHSKLPVEELDSRFVGF